MSAGTVMDGFYCPARRPGGAGAITTLPLVLGPVMMTKLYLGEALEQFVDLVGRHWRDIADTLRSGAEFQPWLEEDAAGGNAGQKLSAGMQLFNDDLGRGV